MDRCRDLKPLFPAYAADTASRAEQLRIQLHLGDGCAACALELERLMEAFHAIPLSLKPIPAPTGSRDNLMDEVRRTGQEPLEVPVLYPETDANRLWKVLVGLSAIAGVAVAFWARTQTTEVTRLEGEVTQTQMMGTVDSKSLERQVQELRTVLKATANPRAHVIDLAGDTATARLFLDVPGGVATLSAEPFGALSDEKLHHVWLLDGEDPSLLGRIPPGFSHQGGQLRFHLMSAPQKGVGALITLDSSGELPNTPGDVVMK